MLSSQSRHAIPSRKRHESDSDRPRHTMASAQGYTSDYGTSSAMPDRQHRSSRRPDTSGNSLAFESAPQANKHSGSKEQNYASGPSNYTSSLPQAQVAGLTMAAGMASSSRSRARDQGHEPDIYAYAKRRTDRQSPRSSEEKIYGLDQGRPSRASQQPRSAYPTANPVLQPGTAYAASLQYQSTRDPTSSSRHRDKDRDKDQERRKERAREKERQREEEERLRERTILEKELEKQRRREERRAEREREKERERRREEKELERARRHREKAKEYEARARDGSRTINPVYPNASLVASKYQSSTDQVPSSSSNIALPATQLIAPSGTRPHTTSDPRRDNVSATQTAPPHVPEKDRKARRSHRDKVLAQQHAQDSGVSSSEQEQGRERFTRDRRHALRDANGDAHYSGPSGSENERGPGHERRKHKTAHDPYATLKQHPAAQQVNASVPPPAQYSAPGPADPETPLVRTKTPFTSAQGRPRDVGPTSMQAQPSAQPMQQLQPRSDMHHGLGTGPTSYPGYPLPTVQPPTSATSYSLGAQGAPGYQAMAPRETALGVEGLNPSATYPSTVPAPSATPRSMTVPTPNLNGPSRPSPAHHQQSLPAKLSHGTPPTKSVEPQARPDGASAHAHHARLSVYHSPDHAASAEFFVPVSTQPQTQFVTVNSTTVRDLAAKFPLNEDFLTSASSSTLNGGTGRPAQVPPAPAQYAPPGMDTAAHSYPARQPIPQSWLPPDHHGATASHKQHVLFENEVPIPVPYPRSATPGHGLSSAMPPSTTAQQQTAARPQTMPLQSKTLSMPPQPYAPTHAAPSLANIAPKTAQAPVSSSASGHLNAASHSPAQSFQQPPQRSPSILNGVPLTGGGTPKNSPSMRLKNRNGSTDTVVYPGAKASPSHSTKHIPHRSSNGNLQATPSSRPDTNPSRPPPATHEYQDTSRYRSQPAAYPAAYPTFNYPPPTANYSNDSYSQPTHPHHARSASQPTVQNPAYDNHGPRERSQTLPTPVPPSPAAAPSASAIAAAYRSGLYTAESASRSQPAAEKRVPPRAAPSPAPTYPAQQQYAAPPSVLSKTGYALSTGAPPSRAPPPTAPSAGRPNGPAMANSSRTISEPQQSTMTARVAISGHPSTPAPTKAQLTSPSEQELLMTPSSLAPSMLKGGNNQAPFPSSRHAPLPAAKPPSTKEGVRKKGGLFSLFRSRSSPPKEDARVADALAGPPPAKPRQRSTSQGTINAVAASVRNIITPHPQPSRSIPPQSAANPSSSSTPRTSAERARTRTPANNDSESMRTMRKRESSPPPQVAAPRAGRTTFEQPAQPGLNSKVFTPFRLVSNKRHRTVSAASNEAADGTQATSTIIGGESARSSTAGRLSPPIPLRDPTTATQVWINKEEAELADRGTWRRRRPGVVFDVSEDFTDTETHPARKSSRRVP